MNPRTAMELVEQAEERLINRFDWVNISDYNQLTEWANKFVREVAVEDVPLAGEAEIVHAIKCITSLAMVNNSDWISFVRKMRPELVELVERVNRGELTDDEALSQLNKVDPDIVLFEKLMKTSEL